MFGCGQGDTTVNHTSTSPPHGYDSVVDYIRVADEVGLKYSV